MGLKLPHVSNWDPSCLWANEYSTAPFNEVLHTMWRHIWIYQQKGSHYRENTGLILGLRPAKERRRYKETPSLIGWAKT